jgi:hypothetical protein
VTLLPVRQIASIVADRELLRITTVKNEQHVITYRLKDLEARLDPTNSCGWAAERSRPWT